MICLLLFDDRDVVFHYCSMGGFMFRVLYFWSGGFVPSVLSIIYVESLE